MKKMLGLMTLCFGLNAFATEAISPLENVEISDINQSVAQSVWDNMKTRNLESSSECFNRALTWTYDMNKDYGIKSRKMIIHYSLLYNQEIDNKWGFHIAPLLRVDGEDIMFDKGFLGWIDTPLRKKDWTHEFVKNGRTKLIRKRKEFKRDYEEAQRDLEELRSRDLNERREERLRRRYTDRMNEALQKMRKFHVTDRDVARLAADRIAELESDIAYFNEKLGNPMWFQNYEDLASTIAEKRLEIRRIELDADQGIHFQCQSISNIEELDFNLTGAWCYTQEISMYYWGIPQLRLLNYGQTNLPNSSALDQARVNGRNFVMRDFDMEQVWAAREEAFKDIEELWPAEYRARERARNAARDQRRDARRRRFGF